MASSADGTKLVAAVFYGQLYTSTDSGVTWTARADNHSWTSVASSADGTKLVAAANFGKLYTSTDSGTNWTARGNNHAWASVASAADGTKLVAADPTYGLYTSMDSGTNWTAHGPSMTFRCVASSADGAKLVAAAGQIYTSTDSGTNWTAQASSLKLNFVAVASSADGTKLAAAADGGHLYTSTDSGTNWTVASDYSRYWRAVVSSADGTKLVAAPTLGELFTYVRGAQLSGGPGEAVTLQYTENGRWTIEATKFVAVGAVGKTQLAAGAVGSGELAAGALSAPVSVSGPTQGVAPNTSYTAAGDTPTSFQLPTTASLGDIVQLAATGAGGWIAENYNPDVWTPRESPRHWQAVASSSDGTKLLAAEYGGQLHTSKDSGVTWTPRESVRNWLAVASSSDGSNLVATAKNEHIYTSTDAGATWTPRDEARYWISVASSADGTRLVAAVGYGGQLYTSIDTGKTWTPRDTIRPWISVASSSDGARLVAAAYGDQLYISSNSGVTWKPRDSARNWISVASSADGNSLLAAEYDWGGRLYVSSDAGETWASRDFARNWFAVASSADGTRLLAAEHVDGTGGSLYTSSDSGANWARRESVRNWCSVASSADGAKLVAAVQDGRLYTSGFETSGGQGQTATLQYSGNGRWLPMRSASTLPDAQLSDNVALRAGGNAFTGNQEISSGNVTLASGNLGIGIGAAAPQAKLDVNGNALLSGYLAIDTQNGNAGELSPGLIFGGGSGEGIASRRQPGANQYGLDFYTDWQPRLSLANNGVLTIDPGNINTGGLNPGLIFGGGSGEGIASQRLPGVNQYGLDFYTDWQPRLSLAANGNVGIGTTTPQAKLDINGNALVSGNLAIDFQERNVDGLIPGLVFGNTDGAGLASHQPPGDNPHGLDFYTSWQPRLGIGANGNVGIGTTAPAEKLEVAGAVVVGSTANSTPKPGTIRWTGSDFEGYTGTDWVSLTGRGTGAVTPISNMAWIPPDTFIMGSDLYGTFVSGIPSWNLPVPLTTVALTRGVLHVQV